MTETWGGIEAGGSHFVCAIGSDPGNLSAEITFPTTSPEDTLAQTIDFFQTNCDSSLSGIGIGSFGPLDLHPSSPNYGHLTSTPKLGWEGTDILGSIKKAVRVPVVIDTDVNAAALAEHLWGSAIGLDSFVYVTVGTGIGGGGIMGNRPLHGLIHPEMGHMLIPHDFGKDHFSGVCPYHGNCLEGLASGPSISERWGTSPDKLPDSHPAWDLESEYLALAIVNLVHVLSPERVVLGGGVMKRHFLFPSIRSKVRRLLSDYVTAPELNEEIETYIVKPQLDSRAGVLGAIALARSAKST